jgi:hypothetical protein
MGSVPIPCASGEVNLLQLIPYINDLTLADAIVDRVLDDTQFS